MAYEFKEASIIKIIDENDVVKRFFIKVPDETPFSFKAGQFMMFNLPIDSKYTNRSYSIASAPSDDNTFELCIVCPGLPIHNVGRASKLQNFQLQRQADGIPRPLHRCR